MQTLDALSTQSLLNRLSVLHPESKPAWGKMNATQMICHLNDSYSLALNTKSASEQITILNRTLIRWLAGGTPPTTFAQDQASLAATIQRFASQPPEYRFNRHPIFGRLTHWEWMRWGFLHADHHFRQFGV